MREAYPTFVTSLVISTSGDVDCFRHTCLGPGFTYVSGSMAVGDVTCMRKPVPCSAREAVWENPGEKETNREGIYLIA